MNHGIAKRLRMLVGTGTWLEVYSEVNEPEKFALGNLVAMDGRWILLEGYDEDGADDGYALRLIEDIFLIVEDSRYIRKLRALRGERAWAGARIEPGEGDALSRLLDLAMESGVLVSIEVMNSGRCDAFGQVRGYDEDVVKLEQFDYYGAADGIAHIPVEGITRVECDGADERRIARLISHQP